MFQINNLRVNADKFYDYLDDRISQINREIQDRQNLTFSHLSLDRDGSKITILEHSSKSRRDSSGRTFEILEVDCEKLDLFSSFLDIRNVAYHDLALFDLTELFKQDMIEDENVVFVVLSDVSEEPYSVEYYVKGIFTDIDRAFEHVNETFDSIVATKLDAANDFYVGGYME